MAKYTSTHTGQQIDNAVDAVANKQDKLVSGTNIKTVNNYSLLGSGNIDISGSGGGITELSTQYVRITDLESGVYKLTYNGTKYLYYYGTSSTSTHTVTGGAGAVVLVVSKYSTTYWHWWYINGTTSYSTLYYGYTYSSGGSTGSKSISNLYTGTPTDTKPTYLTHYNNTFKNTSSYSIYRYQILVFNGTGLSAFTNTSNTTADTKVQLAAKYYPNSPIFYYGSTSTISNNSTFTGSYIYQSYYSINLRYSFNIESYTSTLSTYSPVYIKMSINSDGTLSPVYSSSSSGHPLTNTLPSSEDGYVYVYLGNSGSTNYSLDLEPVHPCFWYKDGKILPYGGGGGGSSGGNVPAGGTAGQVLAKVDSTNYNTHWIDAGGSSTSVEINVTNPPSTMTQAKNIKAPDGTTYNIVQLTNSTGRDNPIVNRMGVLVEAEPKDLFGAIIIGNSTILNTLATRLHIDLDDTFELVLTEDDDASSGTIASFIGEALQNAMLAYPLQITLVNVSEPAIEADGNASYRVEVLDGSFIIKNVTGTALITASTLRTDVLGIDSTPKYVLILRGPSFVTD